MWIKILLLFFVFSFLFRTDLSFDQDLGRHIKLGEIILQTHEVPKVNLFSYTNPDFPFINTHWLFEVLAYIFSQTLGMQTLLILKVIIFLLSVWLILKIIPKENQSLLLPIGFIFLHVLRERLELRPEIFSFLFTASTYFILERFNQTPHDRRTFVPKLIWFLPIIQLIWINTHIYFFVGLLLQGVFLLYLLQQRICTQASPGRLKIQVEVFILSVLVSLINPNGVAGFLYPLNVSKNYGYTIVENQTMFLLESIKFSDPNFLFVKLSLGIAVLSLIRRKFVLKNILLILSGAILALMNVRSFPYLVFLTLPATLRNIGPVKPNTFTKTLALIFAAVLFFESFGYFKTRLILGESAKGAVDFVLANNLPQPIFNNFDIGSYIIYRGYPKYKVFVDGRPEAYPAEFFQNTYIPMQSDYAKFKIEEEKWGFKTIIFSITDQTPWGRNFLQEAAKDKSWKMVYLDNFMVVLEKNKPQ